MATKMTMADLQLVDQAGEDTQRVAVLDAKNKTFVLATAGYTNYTGTCTGYRDFNYRTESSNCSSNIFIKAFCA